MGFELSAKDLRKYILSEFAGEGHPAEPVVFLCYLRFNAQATAKVIIIRAKHRSQVPEGLIHSWKRATIK